jgi:hypothetical protein
MCPDWFRGSWRRNLIDMHVADWDPRFMAEADPRVIADTLELDHGSAVHVFSNSHTGLSYYPTRVGRMHRGLGGKDLLGGLIRILHERGKAVIVYHSVVYNELFWEEHPESRIVDAAGGSGRLHVATPVLARRPCVCCPNNSAYRDFLAAQLAEICAGYDFEGFYPDNCFWPTVCYCPSCRERYEREIGGAPPRTIDWEDRRWVGFQRARQRWIAEFARLITDAVKSAKPGVTVSHQANIWNGDWLLGPSQEMLDATDWLAADAGGDRAELSYVARLFLGASRLKPFEMIRAWYHHAITDHTVAWTEDRMRCAAFAAFIHGGARTFIDAIDPAGTLNRDNHERAGRVYRELERFEPWAGGEPCADAAVYVNFDSFISLSEKGRPVVDMGYNFDPSRPLPEPESHRHAAIGACRILRDHHVLFDVITARNLDALDRYQLLVLPNAVMLSPGEADAIRRWVARGGSLYASKFSSAMPERGGPRADFLLADVFGAHYRGETRETHTYVAPAADDPRFAPFTTRYPITYRGSMCMVEADSTAEILATITLPYTDPRESKYASMLSNPPGVPTLLPAFVTNRYGKGRTLYAAGAFELWDYDTQQNVLANLLFRMLARSATLETNAPTAVEMTLFRLVGARQFVLHALNFQSELPNIPVDGIVARLRLDGEGPWEAVRARDGTHLDCPVRDGRLEIRLPRLSTYEMILLKEKGR